MEQYNILKSQDEITIYCNIKHGKQFSLRARSLDTIETVKTKIQAQEKIPVEKQTLTLLTDDGDLLKWTLLEDDKTLNHYCIGHEETIFLKHKSLKWSRPIECSTTVPNSSKYNQNSQTAMQTFHSLDVIYINCYADTENGSKKFVVSTYPDETVQGVKTKLEKITNIPVDKQLLWSFKLSRGELRKIILKDFYRLSDCSIEDGDSIVLKQKSASFEQKLNNYQMNSMPSSFGIKIYCQAMTGKDERLMQFLVNPYHSIKYLKNEIKTKENIPIREQRLFSWRSDGEKYSWGVLDNSFTLNAYGIEHEDIVFLSTSNNHKTSDDEIISNDIEDDSYDLESYKPQARPNTMKIYCQAVISWFVKLIELEVNPFCTIKSLKIKIETITKIPRATQKLITAIRDSGKVFFRAMDDSQALGDYGVENGSTVFLSEQKPASVRAWSSYTMVPSDEQKQLDTNPFQIQSSMGLVKISCRTVLGNGYVEIEADPSDTIKEIKRKFVKEIGLEVQPCCNHSLVLNCEVLDDNECLKDIGITSESTVYSVVKHLGPSMCLKNVISKRKRLLDSDYDDDIPKSKFSHQASDMFL